MAVIAQKLVDTRGGGGTMPVHASASASLPLSLSSRVFKPVHTPWLRLIKRLRLWEQSIAETGPMLS